MVSIAVAFALTMQGKIAPVEAAELVHWCTLCVVVNPGKKGSTVGVTRIVWGTGLKPGDRNRLGGYVLRDTKGGPNEGKEGDFMSYRVDRPSLVFLRAPPRGFSFSSGERFAELPMIAFSGS